ncbi:bifunctional phosphopantothenoylcysteine decarboxylase/phosphopantothenate synthase [Altererythrobacter sp. SALINAS58]|uniref:bifunctional phosphopantothenoylcysteine decarboxylase/phosphopantothenate synthase n=1 Tax=Alteripontixanthobacter muriae TaxID=2705546 RepID=UPI0015755FA9|nr:bifunctional phosphopantothenoylcysteine decarboxylase/phosphopantothenate synthase [Alteripontixanthobacter muriae]NTZ43149.1 bifunctional phosphopantothenoylcysteine decarboxylase/phosphopantothenate synthase [Alteripontixanthobacter muriae]
MDELRILLVVGGGIAAYKSCELVRLIRKGAESAGGTVRGNVTCVLTEGGSQFVTPMALAALSENPVHTTLWDLKDEVEMGHIQLSRQADLVVVCPATANMLAKMTAGIADDLATTLILATDKPVMAVPAMNVRMWNHEATQRNVAWLRQAGVHVVEPDIGAMACGEFGPGRLPEPAAVWAEIAAMFGLETEEQAPAVAEVPVPADRKAFLTTDDLASEALEPEAETETRSGGLGGLLSSLIARKTPRRLAEREDDDYPDDHEQADEDHWPGPEEHDQVELPEPDLTGPLLAGKGAARSAPPTDPDAINHSVSTGAGQARPQPLNMSMDAAVTAALSPATQADPLDGQPAFETDPEHRPLYGRHVLVTAGPTWEAIDPVRYIANRSSGRQGFAIAAAAADAGARVTLVAGPVALPTPHGVDRIDVESARDMADAVKASLPAEIAVMVAAVADWRSRDVAEQKMKKRGSAPPAIMLTENPDILSSVAGSANKPPLLVGFAAETQDVLENAVAKRKRKGADWIIANDVSGAVGESVMGGAMNAVHIVTEHGVESLDEMPKEDVAFELVERMADWLKNRESHGDYDA